MKTFKGFNKDMTCRGFQYEEGNEYVTDDAIACETGFHACEYPLDCFRYYSPNEAVFHEVEQDGKISKHSDDSKVASSKIKIGASINIAELVKSSIEYTTKRIDKTVNDTGYYGASSATGDKGASSATGTCGASSATGYKGASSATGKCGASSATGDCGASSAENPEAIAVGWGYNAKARGVIGSYIVLAEWTNKTGKNRCWDKDDWELKEAKMYRVDGKKIKEDTWYSLVNGEPIETRNEKVTY